jgi:hypothetical protein
MVILIALKYKQSRPYLAYSKLAFFAKLASEEEKKKKQGASARQNQVDKRSTQCLKLWRKC